MLRRLKLACCGMLAGALFCGAMVLLGLGLRWGDKTWGSPQGGLYVLAATIILGQGIWWAFYPEKFTK